MKILGIMGSPHRKIGSTYKIVERMLNEMEKMGAEKEIVLLSDLDINYCSGCGTCLREGECPQKDDVKEIQEKMLAADGIVLGSPVYVMHVTAQMKTFIDRCVSFGHRPCLQGKYGASVSLFAGVGSIEDVADYLNSLLLSWGATPVGKVCGYAVRPGELSKSVLDQAAKLGRELVQAIKEKWEPQDWLKTETKEQLKQLIVRNKDFFRQIMNTGRRKGGLIEVIMGKMSLKEIFEGMVKSFNAEEAKGWKTVIQYNITGERMGVNSTSKSRIKYVLLA